VERHRRPSSHTRIVYGRIQIQREIADQRHAGEPIKGKQGEWREKEKWQHKKQSKNSTIYDKDHQKMLPGGFFFSNNAPLHHQSPHFLQIYMKKKSSTGPTTPSLHSSLELNQLQACADFPVPSRADPRCPARMSRPVPYESPLQMCIGPARGKRGKIDADNFCASARRARAKYRNNIARKTKKNKKSTC
jgi:hypothetical protein